ncbi:uncharacterized protein LOC122659443 [Telopea speciosissima]|uniref:uncharacterized protein LOC122659443 n=1 Tax=Telopea speciosissima TaxID=54955 RepID=UPI001CC4E657|nr:uncharacterized protein LOC122659443 [Telopea speciosissima]
MVRPKDKFWQHVEQCGSNRFTCNYCGLNYTGSVSRVKAHLACVPGHDVQICSQVPEHILAEALVEFNLSVSKKRRSDTIEREFGSSNNTPTMPQSRSTHQPTMVEMVAKHDKKSLDMLVTEFFVNNNISFNVIQTSSFIDIIKGACAYGPTYVVPSYSNLRGSLIPGKKVDVMQYVTSIKETWGITGCTIMSDSWTDIKKRSWVNVIAYSPGGAVFLKCIECGINRLTSTFLFNEISEVIETVGPNNVVQFISDNGANFSSCGDMLTGKWRHLYRTNCVAHGINLFLKDIHKHVRWVSDVIEDGKLVVDYFHRHTGILALMRQFTNNKEIKQPCKTRFATHFLMLQSLIVVENELRLFVASFEWRSFQFNRAEMTVRTVRII